VPYIITSKFKCTLGKDVLEEEYMGLYVNAQIIMVPICCQISYNYFISIGFKLKLRQNLKIWLVEIKRSTKMMIAEHRIRLANVIPASHVKARFVQLLIITQTLDDSKDGGTEKGEENGGQENDTCINESSD